MIVEAIILAILALIIAYQTESETVKCLAVFVAIFAPFVAIFF